MSGIFVANGKKTKKTSVKHIRIRLIGGCVNKKNNKISSDLESAAKRSRSVASGPGRGIGKNGEGKRIRKEKGTLG